MCVCVCVCVCVCDRGQNKKVHECACVWGVGCVGVGVCICAYVCVCVHVCVCVVSLEEWTGQLYQVSAKLKPQLIAAKTQQSQDHNSDVPSHTKQLPLLTYY